MLSLNRSTLSGIAFASLAVLLVAGAAGCGGEELEGAQAEVGETSVKLDLPAVPEFNIPKANADGTHPIAEMRLRGNRFLGTEVKVTGYVIWIYDCATSIRTPEMTEKELERVLTEEPEKCHRPNIYLGDAADTPADKGIWVVEVPRGPREDEKKTLDDETLGIMTSAWQNLPPFKIGDQVTVTGMWELTSPRGFKNSDGLMVFKAMENLTTPYDPATDKKQ